MNIEFLIEYISNATKFSPISISLLGKGATASVYKVEVSDNPYTIAVKHSKNSKLLKQEYNQIKFINDRVECKLPHLYHYGELEDGSAIMIMEYFDGVSASKVKRIGKALPILTDMVIDNLIKIQSIHNDKYGPVNNAVYDTWYDYYVEFAKEIYEFAYQSYCDKKIRKKVFTAVRLSYERLNKILSTSNGKPTLIHGDYWQPNFIIDKTTYKLIGVIDPFNIMWAEPEYELLALTVGGSKKLKLYEEYKSRVETTEYCDLKLEMYALYNELLWHKKLGTYNNNYLLYRSRRLIKQMKKNKLL